MDGSSDMEEYLSCYSNNNNDFLVDTMVVKPVKPGLHPLDYVLFGGLLLLSLAIGVFHGFTGGKQKTTNEFLLANRSMRVVPVAISMIMSHFSAILVLGNVAEVYTHGARIVFIAVGAVTSSLISAYLFVPVLFPLKLTSKFTYLEMRFDSKLLRRTGSMLTIISSIIYMGVALFAPATALEAVTFFPTWLSIILCGVVAMIYTALGGMKAVIWTDVLQGVVYFGGLIAILILGTARAGGIAEVFRIASEGGRLNFVDKDAFNLDPTVRATVWSLIFGRLFLTLGSTINQMEVQRYLTLDSQKKATRAVLLKIPALLLAYVIVVLLGLVIYAYYAKVQCDPLRAGFISSPNQLLPYFVVHVVNIPGIPGVLLALLYSGALSSLSSNMNSIATVLWKDFFESWMPDMVESRKALLTKMIVIVSGTLSILMAFGASVLRSNILQVTTSFVGTWYTPIFGLFFLGTFFVFCNSKGAFLGVLSGIAFGMWITIGSQVTRPHRATLPTDVSNCSVAVNATIPPPATNPPDVFHLYRISFHLIPFMALATTVVVGLLVSVLTGYTKKKEIDPKLLIPFSKRFCCCMPYSIRQTCSCNEYVYYDAKDKAKQNEDGKEKNNVELYTIVTPPSETKLNEEIQNIKADNTNLNQKTFNNNESPKGEINKAYL